jgi:hypothetical protein
MKEKIKEKEPKYFQWKEGYNYLTGMPQENIANTRANKYIGRGVNSIHIIRGHR